MYFVRVLSSYPCFSATKDAATWTGVVGRLQRSTIFVILLTLALLLIGCGTFGGSNAASISQGTSGDISGNIPIVGSTALLPLAAKAATLFHQLHPAVQVVAEGGGSGTGLKAAANRQADIGDSEINADPVLYPHPNLTDHIICVVAFSLIVDLH